MHLWKNNNPYICNAINANLQVGQENDAGIHENYDMWLAIERMKNTNKWAESPFIEALSNYINCDIIILTPEGGFNHIKSSLTEEINTTRPPMYLGYQTTPRHYQTLEALPGNNIKCSSTCLL